MSKATFLSDNYFLDANISLLTGTENSQFPLSNLKHTFSTKVFRSNEDEVSILIDLQQSRHVDYICLRGSCIEGLGLTNATIVGSSSLIFGTPEELEISQKYNIGMKKLNAALRYWKLTLTGVEYVELGNIFIGPMVQMDDNNISQGFSYQLNTNSVVQKNLVGQRFIDTYGTQKLMSGEIKLANATEFEQINSIHEQIGENIPLWFILDENEDMSIQDAKFKFSGMFYVKDLVWKQVIYMYWDCVLNFEEAL